VLKVVKRLVGAILAALHATTAGAQVQTPQQIARRSFSSVVILVTVDEGGRQLAQGSGFFVREGVVATNWHVLVGAAAASAKLVGRAGEYPIVGIVNADTGRDLVLVSVRGLIAPSLTLGNSVNVTVGDEVYAVGNPEGLEGTFSQGIVSGVRAYRSDTVFQFTAPISPGSSGGPVLNRQGEVIGVAFAAFTEGQNLNFVIPASYLRPLLARLHSPTSLASTRPGHRSQVVARYHGSVANASFPQSPATLDVDFTLRGNQIGGNLVIGPPLGGSGPFTAEWLGDSLILTSMSKTGDVIRWAGGLSGTHLGGPYRIVGGPFVGQYGIWITEAVVGSVAR